MKQMMAAMFLISNNNTNRILDQLGKQIENQSKIIGILLEDRKEKIIPVIESKALNL